MAEVDNLKYLSFSGHFSGRISCLSLPSFEDKIEYLSPNKQVSNETNSDKMV